MRITDVKVLGGGSASTLIEVTTDEGIIGIGLTQSPVRVITSIIELGSGSLKRMLVGEDPRDVGRLWLSLFGGMGAQRGRGGEGGLAVNAMAAIDMALWDITGKALGLPIYKLLGGAVQPQIMAYASATAFDYELIRTRGLLVHRSADVLARESQAYVNQGFKAIKFGWGNYFRPEDEEALAAIREAIGPDIRLMIDFGCPAYWTPGWNVSAAIRAARILEKYGLFFFEEALHPQDVEGFKALSDAVTINIASGESLTTVYEFGRFIDRRALDIVQPDACQMGITQFARVARWAHEAGILCIPHSPWSALAVASHLNVLATLPNGIMIEYPAMAGLEGIRFGEIVRLLNFGIVENPPKVVDGFLQLPDSPGLGLGNYVPEAVADLNALLLEGD